MNNEIKEDYKISWFKPQIKEITNFLYSKNIKDIDVISQQDVIMLEIKNAREINIEDITKINDKYKEIENYFIEDNNFIIKINKNDLVESNDIFNEENENENEKQIEHIKTCANKILVNHKWKRGNDSEVAKLLYNNSNFKLFIEKMMISMRKHNSINSRSEFVVKNFDTESSIILIRNLSKLIPIRMIGLEMTTFAGELNLMLKYFKLNHINEIEIKLTIKKRKRDIDFEENEETNSKKQKF